MTLTPDHPEEQFTEAVRLSVPVPPNLATVAGYLGKARHVAFWWEPCGDEVYYSDGQLSGTGNSNAFLAWMRHPTVGPRLRDYDLGSSEESGTHALLLDQDQEQLQVLLRSEAVAFLRHQHPPLPPLTEEQRKRVEKRIEELLKESQFSQMPSAEEIAKRMQQQHEELKQLLKFLDEQGTQEDS